MRGNTACPRNAHLYAFSAVAACVMRMARMASWQQKGDIEISLRRREALKAQRFNKRDIKYIAF